MDYETYKNKYNDLLKMNDLREYMVQEFVIRPFIQSVMPKLDVIPTHMKINDKNTVHHYEKYCGIGSNGKTITPDLCIANKWNWDNSKRMDCRAVVEVKSPIGAYLFSPAIITDLNGVKENKRYQVIINTVDEIGNSVVRNEIIAHTKKTEEKSNDKTILTDGLTWIFIQGKIVKSSYNLGTRQLRADRDKSGKKLYTLIGIEWEKENMKKNKNIALESIGFKDGILSATPPIVYKKLIGEIKNFCNYEEI